ncbi:MAG: endolytic transglycosylase MltG [Acidobacteria bacterium]|nr:endolytic transglycosylase MltG [Acidobacteriota bacterium]
MQTRTSRKKVYLASAVIIIIIIVVVAVGGGWVWLNREIRRPINHTATQKTITIESGASTSVIVARLHAEGIFPSTLPVKLWLRLFDRGVNLKSGDYRFKSPISPLQVLNQMIRGEIATRQFTIPEGYNQYDIAHVLSGLQGLKQHPMAPEAVLDLLKDVSLIADLDPEANTLEGYLFPDTYEYSASTTREQLVELMVKRFRRVYTPEMQQRAGELGMTTRQAVTMASLIEKEAKVDSERELISSVFHRRLKTGDTLACDPTIIYAALIEGKYRGKIYQSDLDRDSAYNTYKHAGLPPGPIASPGQRSLQAALNPAQTDYLYFVVDAMKKDGSHHFSATSAEHDKAVRLLRQAERNDSK